MDTIFNFGDDNQDDFEDKINIDDLYEQKKNRDQNKINIYKKILSQVHKKIKLTSRNNVDAQCCWYVFPEVILGIPGYNQANCVAYVMHELKENGFALQYTNPNLLFVSWKHWVPTYVRNEIQKRTGYKVDGMGNVIDKPHIKVNETNQQYLKNTGEKTQLFTGERNISDQNTKTSFFNPPNKSIYNMSFFNELNKKL